MRYPVFDLDGTLVDSDEALRSAFVTLGVPAESVTFGHVLADECARLGLSVEDYLDAYDADAAQPFPGVTDLVARLDRWAVCSNKHPRSGQAELARLGWHPDVALFSDAFAGPKELPPVLAALGVDPSDAVFVGDTDHDREAAAAVGCPFVLAAWNPRATPHPTDLIARHPLDVLELLTPADGGGGAAAGR
jgi:HAD superfamily hydrolase (TIGR01549 family)